MSDSKNINNFDSMHPSPDMAGITKLFRFSKLDPNHPEYLSDLLVKGKLYHSFHSQFNDPFECRPHFNLPAQPQKIRKHLSKVAKKQGLSTRASKLFVSTSMQNRKFLSDTIYKSIQSTFGNIRICSFTISNENLLFWSHYADSHKGLCIEFDAKEEPISLAYKINYSNKYPELTYPIPDDERALKPALVKSTNWKYEDEFRTIFRSEAEDQPLNDGTSLILKGTEITNIYFGVYMEDTQIKTVRQFIEKGPFNPDLWKAYLSPSEYKLVFKRLVAE